MLRLTGVEEHMDMVTHSLVLRAGVRSFSWLLLRWHDNAGIITPTLRFGFGRRRRRLLFAFAGPCIDPFSSRGGIFVAGLWHHRSFTRVRDEVYP